MAGKRLHRTRLRSCEYNFLESEGEEDGPYVDDDGEPVVDDARVNVKN